MYGDELDFEEERRALQEMAAGDHTAAALGEGEEAEAEPMEMLQVVSQTETRNTPRLPLPVPASSVSSPSTAPVSLPPREKPGSGFDWRRALVAAGKGDVSQYDRNKLAREQQPLIDEQRRVAMARLDPLSAESKQAQTEFTGQLKSYAQIPGLTDGIRKELDALSVQSSKMSATQIDRALGNVHKLLGVALKGADVEARSAAAQQRIGYQGDMLDATRGQHAATNDIARQSLWERRREFDIEQERKRAADAARAKANRIRLQMKRIDPKAQEELQAITSMDEDLKLVEKELPNAYTGPGAGALVTGSNVVEGVSEGIEKVTGLPTTIKKPESLAATQRIQSLIENAIADVRKARFGSSLTLGEQKALSEWKPGVQLSEQSNRNLISALRKHAAFRAQGKVRQLYQNIGMPIHLPTGVYLPLDAQIALKNEFDSMNQYDDEELADSENRVNEILAPYGGRVGRGGTSAQSGAQQKQPAAAPAHSAAPKAPAGAKPGDRVRRKSDGKILVVQPDGTMIEER